MPLGLGHRITTPADGGTGANPQTVTGLLALGSPGRLHSVNPIIPYLGNPGNWRNQQVMEPCILPDPKDATRLLMYLGGQSSVAKGNGIARATASATNPLAWTLNDTPVLTYDASPTDWDYTYVRCDSVVYDPVADRFLLYYTGHNTADAIGVATSPGNDGVNFTKHPANPIFTAGQITGVTANNASQGAVWRDDATHWWMWYAHRGSDGTLPNLRLASSSDGIAWTDTGIVSWPKGAPGTYDSTFKEWHHIVKLDEYLLVAECYDGSRWTIGAAHSPTPDGVFTPLADPIFSGSGIVGSFDATHVATPAVYNLNGAWYLFYQGTGYSEGSYSFGRWSMGVAKF